MFVVCGLDEVCEVRDGVCVWIVELVSRLEEGSYAFNQTQIMAAIRPCLSYSTDPFFLT